MIERLTSLSSDIVFFPVRHHSPTAAILVKQIIERMRPTHVLIEGPSDFNSQIDELVLDHQFPIAIYSYFRSGTTTNGVFYPFAEHSPEYQAIFVGLKNNIAVEFIDLPFVHLATITRNTHQYADGALTATPGIKVLCDNLGVDDFDGLWDKLIESDDSIDCAAYMERCHSICQILRDSSVIDAETIAREKYMACQIRRIRSIKDSKILVVTGGFHSAGLYGLLLPDADSLFDSKDVAVALPADTTIPVDTTLTADTAPPADTALSADKALSADTPLPVDVGCTLTPFTDERLDAYRGYEAGLPCPGFYHQVWLDKMSGQLAQSHETLLEQAVGVLRQSKQILSTADLMTARAMALGLSQLRGHRTVFRLDLLDGICAAMVKDETNLESTHPLVNELRSIFRGKKRGRLSSLCTQPPLTIEIKTQLESYGFLLSAIDKNKELDLNLELPEERKLSAFLHKVSTLGISGFMLRGFTGLSGDERGAVREQWLIGWSDRFESDCVEASVWGSNLEEATMHKLLSRLDKESGKTSMVTEVLIASCMMELEQLTSDLCQRLEETINSDNEFVSVTKGLGDLLQLTSLDKLLMLRPTDQLNQLLAVCFERSLWLLETIGSAAGKEYISGIWIITQILQLLTQQLSIDVNVVLDVFKRTRQQKDIAALVAGGLTGALYNLHELKIDTLRFDMQAFAAPDKVGDYLGGLFYISQDILKSNPLLLTDLDQMIRTYTEEQFLEAAPPLRLAFTKFTPRQKMHFLQQLSKSFDSAAARGALEVDLNADVGELFANMLLDGRVKETLLRYGLRGLAND